jgi:hypothetical protein
MNRSFEKPYLDKVVVEGRAKCGSSVNEEDYRASAFGRGKMEGLSVCDWVRTLALTDEQKEVACFTYPNIPKRQAYKLYSKNVNIYQYLRALLRRILGRQIEKD